MNRTTQSEPRITKPASHGALAKWQKNIKPARVSLSGFIDTDRKTLNVLVAIH